jgi:hypothetical protein
MSGTLLTNNDTLRRELGALADAADFYSHVAGIDEKKWAKSLLGQASPEAMSVQRSLKETNSEIADGAAAFVASEFSFARAADTISEDLRTFRDLMINYEIGGSALTISPPDTESSARGRSRIDEFIDMIWPKRKKPDSVDVVPLRLFYLNLRIQALQRVRRDKASGEVDVLASGSDENMGIELQRYARELGSISTATVAARALKGMSGPLLISDPYPEERRFCAEMITRLEARAVSVGKRPLADVATAEQLRDRLERIRLVRQVEREMSPGTPVAPQRSDEQRLIDDLLRLARTLKEYDQEAQRILKDYGKEFPELEKEIERKRRELIDRLRDSH